MKEKERKTGWLREFIYSSNVIPNKSVYMDTLISSSIVGLTKAHVNTELGHESIKENEKKKTAHTKGLCVCVFTVQRHHQVKYRRYKGWAKGRTEWMNEKKSKYCTLLEMLQETY